MVDTVQIGTEVQLIDMRTGKLTRQGLIVFQAITAITPSLNELQTDFDTHIALAATTSAIGHVNKATAVTDAVSSSVSVVSANATDLATVITLANEMKTSINTLVTDLNAVVTQLNALLAAERTAGQLTT